MKMNLGVAGHPSCTQRPSQPGVSADCHSASSGGKRTFRCEKEQISHPASAGHDTPQYLKGPFSEPACTKLGAPKWDSGLASYHPSAFRTGWWKLKSLTPLGQSPVASSERLQ